MQSDLADKTPGHSSSAGAARYCTSDGAHQSSVPQTAAQSFRVQAKRVKAPPIPQTDALSKSKGGRRIAPAFRLMKSPRSNAAQECALFLRFHGCARRLNGTANSVSPHGEPSLATPLPALGACARAATRVRAAALGQGRSNLRRREVQFGRADGGGSRPKTRLAPHLPGRAGCASDTLVFPAILLAVL